MKTRRGSIWGSGNENMVTQFKAGDIVKPVIVNNLGFTGVVRAVDARINKVFVAWGGGAVSQHDPDEVQIMMPQDEMVKAKMASRRTKAGVVPGVPDGTGPHGKGGQDGRGECPFDSEASLKGSRRTKVGSDFFVDRTSAADADVHNLTKTAAGVPYDQFVGDPKTHGIDSPRGGGFSIMQDLAKDLHQESTRQAGLKSRRGMYWGAPDRTYRLTRQEQENGSAMCPKCRKDMELQPFVKKDKLYVCPSCGFKVPRSKAVTKIEIEVKDGEVTDVDVTTAKGRRGKMF